MGSSGQDLDELGLVNLRDLDALSFPKTRVFDVEFQARFLSVRENGLGVRSQTHSIHGK